MGHIAINNDLWSYHIIDQLIKQKVVNFCIAPGSRNSPLTLALSQRDEINITTHFDERGLAFYALGLAKATKSVVVIIVTSGTAVGNLLPAIMEANQSNIPLIVITADRPLELKDCGSNQTIDQSKLFQNLVKWQCEISPSNDININYVRSVISYSVYKSMKTSKGPIHINCCFKEPLYADPAKQQTSIPTTNYIPLNSAFNEELAKQSIQDLYSFEKGLIIVGSTNIKSIDEIILISERLKWPIYIELPSRVNISKFPDTFLFQLPYLLDSHREYFNDIDCVLQFGDRLISKQILKWLKEVKLKNYYIVTEHDEKSDESHQLQNRIITSFEPFIKLFHRTEQRQDNSNLAKVKAIDLKLNEKIHNLVTSTNQLSEHFLYDLLSKTYLKNLSLFFGNSSVVRDANLLFFPQKLNAKFFLNRGVSGIDGNIATVIGIADALRDPVIAILGDLTFLHDLTSLNLVKSLKNPVTFFVINNYGGEIFSQLPLFNFQVNFEKLFKLSHELNFLKVADFFNIPYQEISSIFQLKDCLEKTNFQTSQIIELKIDVKNGRNLRKKINQLSKESSCFLSKNMAINEIFH